MIEPLSLRDVVVRNAGKIKISAAELADLELDLEAEIASVRPIADALEVLGQVRNLGYRIAVATNLAAPYSEPVRRLLGDFVDVQAFSFQLGVMKPTARFFDIVCERLKVRPEDALMVGDSLNSDYRGALSAGLQARHLLHSAKFRFCRITGGFLPFPLKVGPSVNGQTSTGSSEHLVYTESVGGSAPMSDARGVADDAENRTFVQLVWR